jgi:RNA polymerase sigma factor for flagellar operon FliA
MHALEQRHGRTPTEGEIAKELEVSLAEYQQMLLEARGTQLVHYEDFRDGDEDNFLEHYVTDGRANPLEQLEDEGFRAHLVTAIDGLPEREKLMMAMYYEQELNLREIGEVLGVSESRVCQLHSQAVARLRGHLKEWLVGGR